MIACWFIEMVSCLILGVATLPLQDLPYCLTSMFTMKTQVILVLAVCYPVFAAQAGIPTVHLLALVPPGLSPRPPYHGGEELISAAQLAVEKINMRNDILPGYRLELVPANAETCNQSLVTEAPVNFVRHVTSGDLNIVGVVGLVCSTVTQAISPLAGRPGIDLLQISAGATSPVFSSKEEYPRLYRMISSSAVYNDAVLALMATFQWRRIGVVQDSILTQYITAANDFVVKVGQRAEFELVFLGDVSPAFPTSPIQSLLRKRARIVYASVTASDACELLCESYKLQTGLRHWLGFVWIFHDLSLEDLMNGTEKCTNEEILRALDGAFLLQYRFEPNPNRTLVSGQTYSEYLMELQHDLGTLQNQHANSFHDSIWAFALAVNNSLSENDLENGSASALLEGNLKSVNFSGALGRIVFNEDREVVTEVDIFQFRGSEMIYAGHYNPLTRNVTVQLSPGSFPMDDFEDVVLPLSLALPMVTLVITVALLLFTTVVLVLFLYYWNKPLIKATSPHLSALILSGCYIVYIGALIAGTKEISDPTFFGRMCQAEIWFTATGIQLIYSTLLVRLLRIYRIFFYKVFEMPGKIWSNGALVALVFIPVSVTIILLIVWTVVDPVPTDFSIPLSEQGNDFPRVTAACGGNFVEWTGAIVFGVNGSIIVAVTILGILTRKVQMDSFKDSKEVNLFVFSTVLCLCTWFPYALTFVQSIRIPEAGYCFTVFPYLVIPFLCKVILFIPKIWSSRHERRTIRRNPLEMFSMAKNN